MRTVSHHLLVVDDDEEDRMLLDLSFREIQWNDYIKLLSSGDGLFRYLQTLPLPAQPVLILLDYYMPLMGAEEILRRLKAHVNYCHIRVDVYSTEMTELLCSKLKILGAASCYIKTVEMTACVQLAESLKREVQRLLNEA